MRECSREQRVELRGEKGERRPVVRRAPPLLRQRKPYLTGSPPSRLRSRYRQGVAWAEYSAKREADFKARFFAMWIVTYSGGCASARELLKHSKIYFDGREPTMRISTSRWALCCQSGPDATLETPIRARSKSKGAGSLRMSPLLMARLTSASMAPWI